MNVEAMLIDPNEDKIIYIDDNNYDHFGERLKNVSTQIDVFNDLLEELDEDNEPQSRTPPLMK